VKPTRLLLWIVGALLMVAVISLWPDADVQTTGGGGVKLTGERPVNPGETLPSSALPANTVGLGSDLPREIFSPPPGATVQLQPTISPFAVPEPVKSRGSVADWGGSLPERVAAYWRSAPPKPATASTAAPAVAAPAAAEKPASAPAQTAAVQATAPTANPDFETPPGIGSPRGGK